SPEMPLRTDTEWRNSGCLDAPRRPYLPPLAAPRRVARPSTEHLAPAAGEYGTSAGHGGPSATPPTQEAPMAVARVLRRLAPILLMTALMTFAPSVAASSGPAVRGGGVVDGD